MNMGSYGKQLAINLAFLVVTASALLGFIFYLSNVLQTDGKEVMAERTKYMARSDSAGMLANLKRDLPETFEYTKKIDLLLPGQDQLLGFPEFFRSIASQNQIDVTFNFQTSGLVQPREDDAGFITFQAKASGEFQNLQDFLEAIEEKTIKFWIGIDSYDLVKSGDSYVMQMQGKVFFK